LTVSSAPPRLRQAVLAARELEPVVGRLRSEVGLGEPHADPGVEYFGLHNAVFALGDTFLEVVSPLRDGTAAGRQLDRRGGDCGYMVMAQVEDLAGARERARALGIREVFEVELDDIAEVHLHPADIGGAIVSLSRPEPPGSWRWAGPGWEQRSVPPRVAGATLAVSDASAVAARWREVIGGPLPGVRFTDDETDRGLIEIAIAGVAGHAPLDLGGVRLVFDR
jgi:Glyoxalase-like domain